MNPSYLCVENKIVLCLLEGKRRKRKGGKVNLEMILLNFFFFNPGGDPGAQRKQCMVLRAENLGIHINKQGWGELSAKVVIPREGSVKALDTNNVLKTPLN